MNLSPLQKARYEYSPKLPGMLRNGIAEICVKEGVDTQSVADQDKIKALFPNTYGKKEITFEKGQNTSAAKKQVVGVILSGGQAPGGHNVITGLYDALKATNPDNVLYGFKGGPDGRRRFMDSALCQVYRPYLVALRRYMRLTAQKNALLKSYDITPNGNMLLDTYDEQLAEYGALIMEHRCKFLAAAAPIAAQNYKDISHGAEVLALNYQMCTAAPTAAALTEKMRAMRSAELRAGFCLAGPHREDLEILLDGQPARVFGSQGQQRSCVLAMKLAEATVVGDLFGEHPVLLLDDVLSELDDERQTYLLTRMGEHQTIVTTCDTAAFARTNGKIVMVKGGVVEEA